MATIPTSDREVIRETRRWAGVEGRSWLAPWLVVVLIAAVVVVEFTTAPVERVLGAFMTWSQPVRGEMGRGWDLNREGAAALETLAELAEASRQRQEAGAAVQSLLEIPALLDSFQVFSITPERFVSLYSDLPDVFQARVLDPVAFVRARAGGEARRVFFVDESGRYRVYIVDGSNETLVEGTLARRDLARLADLDRPRRTRLDDFPSLPVVLDDEVFFTELAPSGPVNLSGGDLEWISSLQGELLRVGLAASPEDGLWPCGFEVRRAGQVWVHRYWLAEDSGMALLREVQRRVSGGGLEL